MKVIRLKTYIMSLGVKPYLINEFINWFEQDTKKTRIFKPWTVNEIELSKENYRIINQLLRSKKIEKLLKNKEK